MLMAKTSIVVTITTTSKVFFFTNRSIGVKVFAVRVFLSYANPNPIRSPNIYPA
jgi:hypothetical protein